MRNEYEAGPAPAAMQAVADILDDGNPLDSPYDEWVVKFLDEFEWYCRALKRARSRIL